jgi:hypothetical protein
MPRQLFSSALIFFTVISATAQTSRPSLSIGAGLAVPMGKFAETKVNNAESGFAKTGTMVNIAYSQPVGRRIWAEVTVQFQRNPLNTKKMEEAFSNTRFNQGVFVSPTVPPQSTFPDTLFQNWKFKNDSWLTSSLLLGINGRYPMGPSNKIFARARISAGPVYVVSPEIDGTSTGTNGVTYLKQTSESGWGMAFTAGGGIEFELNSRLYFITNVQSFLTTGVKFEDVTTTLTSLSGPSSNPSTVIQTSATADAKQTISTLNFNVGVGLKL